MDENAHGTADGMARIEVSAPCEVPIGGRGGEERSDYGISKKDAADCFYKLAGHFYNKNFGTFPKSEIDLFMFRCLDKFGSSAEEGEAAHGDGSKAAPRSELQMAMMLGTTPRRIANLREKIALRDNDYNEQGWKEVFKAVIAKDNIIERTSVLDNKVHILLQDRLALLQLSDAMVQSGYFFDLTFNSKALVIPVKVLVALMLECYSDDDEDDEDEEQGKFPDTLIKKLKDRLSSGPKEDKQLIHALDESEGLYALNGKNRKAYLLELSQSIIDLASEAVGMGSGVSFIGEAIVGTVTCAKRFIEHILGEASPLRL